MSKKKQKKQPVPPELRLDPSQRVTPTTDSASIRKYRVAGHEMGVRIVDNAAEEHQM